MNPTFEHIRIYTCTYFAFKKRAALTIPYLGIIVNPLDSKNNDLLRHEFGHMLQYRKWGFYNYFFRIAPLSLWSAYKSTKNKQHQHMVQWTEWTANALAYTYFKQPSDWNHKDYPITGQKNNRHAGRLFF